MRRKKVLIVGGAGIAGQAIVEALMCHGEICDLYVASRGFYEIQNRGITSLRLDIHDAEAMRGAIRQFDVVVLALGPFSEVGTDVYVECLRHGIVCIDINDDYRHCRRVLEIGETTSGGQGTILTGMGLCPGMTSYMLAKAVEHLGEQPRDAHLRIYFGAGVASGRASIANMFNAFKDEVQVLSAGEIRNSRDVRNGLKNTFTFDETHSDLPLVYFSSPEIVTIHRSARFVSIRNFDSAFHLQHLPMWLVFLLRRSAMVRRMVIKMAGAQQGNRDDDARNEKAVIVDASVRGQERMASCSLRSDSSYRLTGVFCASMLVLLIRGGLSVGSGVYCFEDLDVGLDALDDLLSEYEVNVSVKTN